MIEIFSNSEILAGMITPAVLVTASASLIFSTANRLGRIFDRVNLLKTEAEKILDGKKEFAEKKMEYLGKQLTIQKRRAVLIQRSMAFLYTATSLFVVSSLTIAITIAFARDYLWLPTIFSLLGGFFLFLASAFLLYESRYNLSFIMGQIEMTEFLKDKYYER
jgi:hypothetical protein